MELGAELLCKEEFWLPFGFIRSVIVKKVRGGLSAVFKSVLRAFFTGDESFDGIGVMINGILFFARLTNLLADDDALTKVYCVRGAAGLLPCLECKNVLAADRRVVPGGYFVTVACSDPNRFDMLDDQDHWDRVDKLEEHFQTQKTNYKHTKTRIVFKQQKQTANTQTKWYHFQATTTTTNKSRGTLSNMAAEGMHE